MRTRSTLLEPLALLLAFTPLALVGGCQRTLGATRVMLLIDAEPGVRARSVSLEVDVRGGQGEPAAWSGKPITKRIALDDAESHRWPLELALEPRGADAKRGYALEIRALDADGAVVVSARAISGYRAQHTLALVLLLEDGCIAHDPCDADATCRAGECTDARIPVSQLPRYTRDARGEPILTPPAEPSDAGSDAARVATLDDAGRAPRRDAGGETSPGENGDAGTSASSDASTTPDGRVGQAPAPPASEQCPAGQGWEPDTKKCVACQEKLRCNAVGETGHVLLVRADDSAHCECETEPDYFIGSDAQVHACDADGDGWIVEDAWSGIEHASATVRANTRCRLRRAQRIVLINEQGERSVAAEFPDSYGTTRSDSPIGLPLYESARNDGAAGLPPLYGQGVRARPFSPRELNSLTKACSDPSGDFDDDGVADIAQHSGSNPTRSLLGPGFEQYKRFSYFLELHDGWYDEVDGVPSYFIAEKARDFDAEHHIALLYPENLDPNEKLIAGYAQNCRRHADGLYLQAAVDRVSPPLRTAVPSIGADFVEFTAPAAGEAAFHGMTHHSQFKCVLAVSEAEYANWPDGGASEQKTPHVMYVSNTPGELGRKDDQSNAHAYRWWFNDCVLDSTEASLPAHGPVRNPSLVGMRCTPLAAPVIDSVGWAVVGYQDYATPYIDAMQRGGYARGCVNACIEPIARDQAHDCRTCGASLRGEANLVADVTDLPVDDGNACTLEGCQDAIPVHAAAGIGSECGGGVCDGQGQCSACLQSKRQCTFDASASQECDATGHWGTPVACGGSVCSGEGQCGVCMPGQKQCATSTSSMSCDGAGHWGGELACSGSVCSGEGQCGVCMPGRQQCSGSTLQTCDGSGQWGAGTACQYGCALGACRQCPVGTRCCTGDEVGCEPPCFAAGTLVTLADGSQRAIETLAAGDWVLSYDTESRRARPARVTHRFVHPDTERLVVLNHTLITTPEHRFYVEGRWRAADELAPAMQLTRLAKDVAPPRSAGAAPPNDELLGEALLSTESKLGPITTYNLEVEALHTYFAGGYLVHNVKR